MKIYKLTPLMILLVSIQTINSSASYGLVYPLENINFINIKSPDEPEKEPVEPEPVETWSQGESIITDWVYGPKTCTNWIPTVNTKPTGVSFQQSANDCTGEKTRTVQNTEISSLGNKRNIGDLITESETENNQKNTKTAYGTRFTHTMQVAHYFGWGTTHYYGYFAPIGSYASFERYDPASLSPSTINGQQIEFLTDQGGVTIFRTINGVGQATLVNYEITVNGKTCPFEYNDTSIPVENRILVARCALFNNLASQTVKVDISPKQ
jgi:hypothetical protein